MKSKEKVYRLKYWEELTDSEKIEELKRIVKYTFETIVNMGVIVENMAKCEHRSTGKGMIPTIALWKVEDFVRDKDEHDFGRYRENPFNEKPK